MSDRFLIGYARVSTDDQDLRMQIDALTRYGVPEQQIVKEKASGGSMDRRGLKDVLKALRDGDRVVVWKLDRLGRSLTGVIEVVERIHAAGADIVSITEKIDTSSAMGKAFFQITLVFAELERNMISERTKAGIAAKRLTEPDKKWGKAHMINDFPKRLKHLQALYDGGEFTVELNAAGNLAPKKMNAGVLMKELNAVDPDAPQIGNAETVRRWFRDGCEGLNRERD